MNVCETSLWGEIARWLRLANWKQRVQYARMFERLALSSVRAAAARFPVVAIIGARQVGKTTLAHTAFPDYVYRDLEDPRTAERFRDDARFALDEAGDRGLVLDEAQVVPEVFAALRGAVDARRAANGRFVVLGSAQPALVRGVAESLAGRAAVVDLDPLCAGEAGTGGQRLPWRDVWLKGGFRSWWEAYLRLVLERDLPHYGVRADPLFVRRLLTMLAHQHGGLLNASALGGSLGVSHHTVQRYLDVLDAIFLVRRLPPYFRNVGKRLTKASKVYLRDTGLLHHLLNISNASDLQNHPVRGASWEGFVIEDVLRRERIAKPLSQAYFWRTAAGAEADLLLDRGDARVAIEIKAGRGDDARTVRTLREALPDMDAQRAWIVDQTPGIARLDERIARAGFDEIIAGVA
jgi:predicted AAA+ superfamily ATPase